jgi:hypothetical protein
MNRENAHLFLPLVQALADGKTIQVYHPSRKQWEDSTNVEFIYRVDQYRIKPEPRKWVGMVTGRSWKANEGPAIISIQFECDVNSMPDVYDKLMIREILDDGGAE